MADQVTAGRQDQADEPAERNPDSAEEATLLDQILWLLGKPPRPAVGWAECPVCKHPTPLVLGPQQALCIDKDCPVLLWDPTDPHPLSHPTYVNLFDQEAPEEPRGV